MTLEEKIDSLKMLSRDELMEICRDDKLLDLLNKKINTLPVNKQLLVTDHIWQILSAGIPRSNGSRRPAITFVE